MDDIQEQLREQMRREQRQSDEELRRDRMQVRNSRHEFRRTPLAAPDEYVNTMLGRNGHPEIEQDPPRRARRAQQQQNKTSEQLDVELENTGNPPALDAALRSLLRGYGMDFLNFKSKGHFEGFGPYFVDNTIEFDSARRYASTSLNSDPALNVSNGLLQFQVGDFINDINTSSALFNLAQMEITPFYIPLCGNEKIARWGIVQLFIREFLSDSTSRNREQRGNWHWEMTVEVVGPRIRLSPNPQQRLFTFRVPIKRVDDVLSFEFRTPSGPVVFCNEFAPPTVPGAAVAFDGVDTFQTLQAGGAPVNHGFNVGEIVALERVRPPGGPNAFSGQWLPFFNIPGTDAQGMEILALPSASEIRVDPADVDAAVLPPIASNEWRLHNFSREVLIPLKFRSIRSEPTQYLIATSR